MLFPARRARRGRIGLGRVSKARADERHPPARGRWRPRGVLAERRHGDARARGPVDALDGRALERPVREVLDLVADEDAPAPVEQHPLGLHVEHPLALEEQVPQVVRDDRCLARTAGARRAERARVRAVAALRERREGVLGEPEVQVVGRALELPVDLEAPRCVGDERHVELERDRCRVARRVLTFDAEARPVRRVREERIGAPAIVMDVPGRAAADAVERVRAEERQAGHDEPFALLRGVRVGHLLLVGDERGEVVRARRARGSRLHRGRLLGSTRAWSERDDSEEEGREDGRRRGRHRATFPPRYEKFVNTNRRDGGPRAAASSGKIRACGC